MNVSPEQVYGKHNTLLAHYYELRGSGILEPGAFRVLRELLLPHAPDLADAEITRALRAMYSVTQTNWKAERDAARTLRALQHRGLPIGAVSNGSDDWNALELLRRAGLLRYFGLVLTSAAFGRRKPDPAIFQAALDHFHAQPEKAVMIGDSPEADVQGAGALGIRTIWITKRVNGGEHLPPKLPDARVRELRSIPALLA